MNQPEKGRISALEESLLPQLRNRFESLGYTFSRPSDASGLPAFMKGYIPDAIAAKPGENVAIEIKSYEPSRDPTIAELFRRFEGQPDWKLTVVHGGEGEIYQPRPLPSVDAIQVSAREVRRLAEAGFGRAALVMAFALLEATINAVADAPDTRPKRPATVIQSFAADGYLDKATETRLLSLVSTRNQIVHGAVEIDVSPDDALFVLSAAEQALSTKSAD